MLKMIHLRNYVSLAKKMALRTMADRHPRENKVSSNTEQIILNGTQSFESDNVDNAFLLELRQS